MVWEWRWKYAYFKYFVASEIGSKVLPRTDPNIVSKLSAEENYTWAPCRTSNIGPLHVKTAILNLWTERNASLWIPRPDRRLKNPKIWEFLEENQPDMYMWTGIERFDANRFWINGQPTYAPKFFNHTETVQMSHIIWNIKHESNRRYMNHSK